MPAPTPPWRRLFDRIENAIGRPLEQKIADPRVNEALLMGLELSRGLSRRWRAGTSNLRHLGNQPSYSDVRRLERRLGQIEKQLLDLSAAMERMENRVTATSAEPCQTSAPRNASKGSTRSARKSNATPGARATD
ncbi:MAG: hypothetical protein ACT4PZ_14315 [Panacagrimonas sp.]